VEIGDDQPIRCDDEAGALAAGATDALDATDGGTDAVHGISDSCRIIVEQRIIELQLLGGEGHGRAPCL
jgi:hypothetical protein